MGAGSQPQRFVAEVGRFLLVGGAATLTSLLVFNVLTHGLLTGRAVLDTQPILAFAIANTIGMLVSYQGSRTFVFRDSSEAASSSDFVMYVVINVATMVLPIACLSVSRSVLGLEGVVADNVAANVVGLVLGLAARFYLFRTFVFQRPIHLTEIYDEPGLHLDADPEVERAGGGPVSGLSTDRSTIGPLTPPFA